MPFEGSFSAWAGLANLLGAGGRGGEEEARRALALWAGLRDPNFDFSDITPAELEFISQVSPETYEAAVPASAALAQQGATRSDQVSALRYLQDVQRQGMPLADRLAAESAADALAREHARAQEGVISDLAARGRLGGGTELQARLMAGQGNAALAGELGRGLAMDALNRRYGAALDAGGLASGIRSQDEALSARNADSINRFNELVASLRTGANRYAADAANATNLRNASERQRIADTNALLRQDTARDNLERRNNLAAMLADFDLQRTAGMTGQLGQLSHRMDARRAAKEKNIFEIGRGFGAALDSALGMAGMPGFSGPPPGWGG